MNNNAYVKTLLDLSPFPTECQYKQCDKKIILGQGRTYIPIPKLFITLTKQYHEHAESSHRCPWTCGNGHQGVFEIKNNDCPVAGCPFKRKYNIELNTY